MYKTSFKVFSVFMVLAMILMAVPMQKAQALSADVVISQVDGGGGNAAHREQ